MEWENEGGVWMAGIVGEIGKPVQKSLLSDMVKEMKYTGRDKEDSYSDDFLSITRVNHGVTNSETQPIFSEDGSMFIVMDGEVFDYEKSKQQLINKGHKFDFEHNDAEYCLHLYEELGENAFKELNGSFCIAIYNLATREFLLISDRFSSHLLFYYLTNEGKLLFGTQLSLIIPSPEVPRDLDVRSIFEFFAFQRVLGTKTYYKNVNIIPPATVLRYQDGTISFASYWEMRYKEEKNPEQYYVNELANALKKSVERRTQGKYRFGILLSGGLDSRAVFAATDKEMITFTFGDFENYEVEIAREVANVKNCKHVFLKRDLDHYVNLLDSAVKIGDGMHSFPHAHSIGFFRQMQKECDILLHGNPPELFFRGSSLPRRELKVLGKNIPTSFLYELSDSTIVDAILKKMAYRMYPKNPKQLFTDPYSSVFDRTLADSIKNILADVDKKVANIYDKFLWFDIYYTSRYPSFLVETSIRAFMDERTILFDNDLFDLYLKMPFKIRSNSRVWKKALAKLDPEIANIPDANTGHSPFIPAILDWILNLSKTVISKYLIKSKSPHPTYKQGSWPNYAEMIRHNDKLKKLIQETIEDPECLNPSLFDIQKIKEIFKRHLNGKEDYRELLFLVLTFGRWHKKYGPHNKNYVGE